MSQLYTSSNKPAQSLQPDFEAFLREVPVGETFNLWHVQGALRFTRDGVPAEMAFGPELRLACTLGLITEIAEDKAATSKYQAEYGRDVQYGRSFVRLRAGQLTGPSGLP